MSIDFYTFVLGEVNAIAARKIELKNAFAKQVSWTEKITNEEGKEIDNPVSFQEAFNDSIWQFVRQTCVAGQQKIDKEAGEEDDTFEDLVV